MGNLRKSAEALPPFELWRERVLRQLAEEARIISVHGSILTESKEGLGTTRLEVS